MNTLHNRIMSQSKILRLLLLCVAIFGCSLARVSAEEQNVNPGINRHYQDAEYQKWLERFERPGREVYDQRHAVVQALHLTPGLRIADIGAGTGFYSLLFAQAVGDTGTVYAVDISDNFIENIKRRAHEQGYQNIIGVLSNQKETLLPANSIDIAFTCDTYHHFEYPQTLLASIHRALNPGGRLVIIDFKKESGVSSGWVMSHVRADKQQVIREIEQAGFRFISDTDLLKTDYFLWFEKRP